MRVRTLDATPQKRLFLSIISDYDLKTGLCELIDNAIDQWTVNGRPTSFCVEVLLDVDRQLISVRDNAGGVSETELNLLVSPGLSRPQSLSEVIGIFGVGGKRAGIALGERVEIRTRKGSGQGYAIELTNDWLNSPEWEIGYNEIQAIPPSTTEIHISSLRQPFSASHVLSIHTHLSETYSWFINKGCDIRLNREKIKAAKFDQWSYPPEHPPRKVKFTIEPAPDQPLHVTIEAGLIKNRSPEEDNYGVYLYCNDRLIVKEEKSREFGYVRGQAGIPHPDASLCRVIVRLNGSPEAMPWNSSKSGLNFNHPAFTSIYPQIVQLLSHYSSLSRRLKHSWDDNVFAYSRGSVAVGETELGPAGPKVILPALPRTRPLSYVDDIEARNAKTTKTKPWLRGIVESFGFIDLIAKLKPVTRSRVAFVLIDSNFEIALKEYIVHHTDFYPESDMVIEVSNS